MISTGGVILIVCADAALTQQFVAELGADGSHYQLPLAATPAQARLACARAAPTVILLDESALSHSDAAGPAALEFAVASLSEFAPIVAVAAPERQSELAFLMSAGAVDFVARVADFVPVAAGFIERRVRLAARGVAAGGSSPADFPEDFGEVLRHEVNNPLTGILGNAELLLAEMRRHDGSAQGGTAAALERLQTIADLAVRLRETIRRLSNDWEARQHHVRSA